MEKCRVCMNSARKLFAMFSDIKTTSNIPLMITECARIEVRKDDGLPQSICNRCFKELEIAFELIKKCKASDQIMKSSRTDSACGTNDVTPWSTPSTDVLMLDENFDPSDLDSLFQNSELSNFPDDDLVLKEVEQEQDCCECGETFESFEQLLQHAEEEHVSNKPIYGHNSTNGVECTICFRMFSGVSHLDKNHQQLKFQTRIQPICERNVDKIQCCACESIFLKLEDLQEHSIEHIANKQVDKAKPFECNICYRRYSMKQSLVHHKIYSFSYRKKMIQRRRLDTLKKEIHSVGHKGMQIKKCCACFTDFNGIEELMEHSQTQHEPWRKHFSAESPFECDVCYKRFPTKYLQQLHNLAPYSEKFRCHICDKRYATRPLLKRHLEDHVSEKVQCHICKQTLKNDKLLDLHLQTHVAPSERYICAECGRIFFSKYGLKAHMKVHSDEKPFECTICHKTFKRKHLLQNHSRVHTREKPFKCSFCEKTFSHKTDKSRHEMNHTGNYPHECLVCHKKFSRKNIWESHVALHYTYTID